MKTAIIYARVSSTTDRQNTERQISDLINYAKNANLEIVKKFEEKISGAAKNINRPVLQEAMDYCILSNIDIILCSEMSRLSRNVYELQDTIKYLIEHKIN